MTRVLVTGAAGFIGFHTAQRLLDRGDEVVGLDNLNDYYSVKLKQDGWLNWSSILVSGSVNAASKTLRL